MKGTWKKVVTAVAVVAVAWSLVSPAIILKQQGEISSVQTGNHSLLNRLTKDENVVAGFGAYIVKSNAWDNVIFLDVCQQFHLQISCTAPPAAP